MEYRIPCSVYGGVFPDEKAVVLPHQDTEPWCFVNKEDVLPSNAKGGEPGTVKVRFLEEFEGRALVELNDAGAHGGKRILVNLDSILETKH